MPPPNTRNNPSQNSKPGKQDHKKSEDDAQQDDDSSLGGGGGGGEDVVPTNQDLFKFMQTMKSDILKSINQQAATINELTLECKTLREEVNNLKSIQNTQEQRQRNYSVRLFNLPLTDNQRNNTSNLIQHVYNKVLKPILQVCVNNKEIDSIPAPLELIEYGHPLKPSKNAPPNSHSPIILRFFSRTYRLLVLKNKRQILEGINRSQPNRIFMTEDLTKLNYNRLMELSKDDKVERCFTQNGKIKFSLKDDPDKKLLTDTIG